MSAVAVSRDKAAPYFEEPAAVVWPVDSIVTTPHLWTPVTGFTLVASSVFILAGYRTDDPTIGSKLALYLISVAVAFAALKLKLRPRLAWAVSGVLQATAISTGGMMLTYAAASLDLPLIDDNLLRFDRALGYRWESYAEFVRAHHSFCNVLFFFYMFIFCLPVIIIFALSSTRRFRQINRYIIATATSLTLTAGIFALCPALTAWDHLGIDHHLIQQLKFLPDVTSGWERDLLDIREGRGFMLHHTNGSGLTAFPSYHCVAGLIFVWALWPAIWIRLPSIIAASLLIAAAPIFGGHYLADLVGGAVVTVVSIAAAYLIEHHWHRRGEDRQ